LTENVIIIPIYNDWKSLNKLLAEINATLDDSDLYRILIIDDCSTQAIDIKTNNLDKIKEIKILSLNQNLGSQKSICVGLNYLKRLNKNFYITVMDGDGEDNPSEIKGMFSMAQKNLDCVVTSHRIDRKENFLIKFSYKLHLIISFIFTFHWISFGNFTCFNSNNLKKLNLNDVWYAHSAAVIRNCKIKKIYSSRQKRYFESSKVNFIKLIEHSLRIISVFYNKVVINSLLLVFIFQIFNSKLIFIMYALILFLNLLLLFTKIKNYKKPSLNLSSFIKKIKILN
jgi:hypothetical protein